MNEEISVSLDDQDIEKIIDVYYKTISTCALNKIFNDNLIINLIKQTTLADKIKEIKNLEECQTQLKPSTFYLGAINRMNYKVEADEAEEKIKLIA